MTFGVAPAIQTVRKNCRPATNRTMGTCLPPGVGVVSAGGPVLELSRAGHNVIGHNTMPMMAQSL